MNLKGRVDIIEVKKTQKGDPMYTIQIGNDKVSDFGKPPDWLKEGIDVSLEYTLHGHYKNMMKGTLRQEASVPTQENLTPDPDPMPEPPKLVSKISPGDYEIMEEEMGFCLVAARDAWKRVSGSEHPFKESATGMECIQKLGSTLYIQMHKR